MSVGLGILGFAHGHGGMYLRRWRERPDWGVRAVAGWDHDGDRLRESAEAHGVEPAADAQAIVEREGVDAVLIAAETSLHADLVEIAAAAGRAIVLQKPAALTLEEADRIVEAVGRAGVPFTMAWQMRHDPQNIEVKRLIESGAIGPVRMVRRRHCLSTHRWDWFPGSWHVKPELNRGMWADDAAHAIDFLLWLLGEPVSVTAEIDTLVNPAVPDDHGVAVYRYADGTFAEVVSSFTCTAGENTTEVVGDNGVIIQNYGDAPSCNAPRPNDAPGLKWLVAGEDRWHESEHASPATHGERIAALAEPLAAFLRGEREPIATAEEGRTALKMTLACYASARTGRRVDLTAFDHRSFTGATGEAAAP